MTTMIAVAKAYWMELTNGHEFPTEAVKQNLTVNADAVYIAQRLKKEPPDFNRMVLLEAARLLDIDLSK